MRAEPRPPVKRPLVTGVTGGTGKTTVAEGMLGFHDPELRERLTLNGFVDAPPDERFIRRLERDAASV